MMPLTIKFYAPIKSKDPDMYMLTWKDVQDVSVKWKIKFYIYLSISRSYKKKKSVFMCCLCACKRKANDVKYIYQNWEKGWDRKERELQLKKHTHLGIYFLQEACIPFLCNF